MRFSIFYSVSRAHDNTFNPLREVLHVDELVAGLRLKAFQSSS
ncbi:MAG: hypothetical protein RMJ75_07515 [Nitrososphaerota archaeon]|nr:hypothetical protein [Nitrososphaerota archaeon]